MSAVTDGATAPPATQVHLASGVARGTVVVLTGRGEHPRVYARLGTRLALDGYTVVVPGTIGHDLGRDTSPSADDDDDDDKRITDAFASHPDGARVLLGSDAGAVRAWSWAADHPGGVDALVLAGLPLGTATTSGAVDHATELDLRTACPVHRSLLEGDSGFAWGALAQPVDAPPETLPAVASLLVHGAADQIAPLAPVQELARGAEGATLAIVDGGLHDVLNDQFHRSIAARLVTFLERVVKGAVVWDDTARPTVAPATRGVGRRAGLLHVSARVDYALRAVAALPSDPAAEPVRCETVARSKGIPLNSLVNLMIDLRRAGLVRSRRGCEGGYWLARPAAEITVADVARAVEGVIAPVPDEPIWSELGRAVTDFLEDRNLESSP